MARSAAGSPAPACTRSSPRARPRPVCHRLRSGTRHPRHPLGAGGLGAPEHVRPGVRPAYGHGIAALGLDPGRLVLVRGAPCGGCAEAALEAARARPSARPRRDLGSPKVLDLTASRRLSLAAAASGVTVLATRVDAAPAASAATSRWQVRALFPRTPQTGLPGIPAFPSPCCATGPAFLPATGPWSGIVNFVASANGRRYLAVWMPFLPTERLSRHSPPPRATPAHPPLQAGRMIRLS